MFSIAHAPVVLHNLKLGWGVNTDGERVPLCRLTFHMPVLTYELARSIDGVGVVQHCFSVDRLPLWDVSLVHLAPPMQRYTIALRIAPDLVDETATILLAEVQRVRVWRPSDKRRDLALEFITLHELPRGDARDLHALISVWDAGSCYATFTASQMALTFDDDAPADGATEHD
jgi:hypothetical protein